MGSILPAAIPRASKVVHLSSWMDEYSLGCPEDPCEVRHKPMGSQSARSKSQPGVSAASRDRRTSFSKEAEGCLASLFCSWHIFFFFNKQEGLHILC